jgi:metal-responsive CopG/Arc/MetJ family transcriptional regulator
MTIFDTKAKQTGVKFSNDQINMIDEVSRREGSSRAGLIRKATLEYLAKNKKT